MHNNGAIIDLIRSNCSGSSKVKLHTFGVGNGADEALIKGCAFAGLGNFTFIYKDSEIEQKVMESVSKTKLEYLLINKAMVVDENDELIRELPNLPAVL